MAGENIKIVIKKGDTPDGVSPSSDQVATAQTAQKQQEQGKSNIQQDAINAALIEVGKSVMISAFSKYADFTGDYATVRTINNVITIATDIAIIAKTGGIGAVYVAGKYATQFVTSELDRIRNVQELEYNNRRLGEISLKGSRY